MTQFIKALKKSELVSGAKKTIIVAGKKLMVAHIDGEFFAIDDACTHAGCSLGGEGTLAGDTITCGCHGGQFAVSSGKAVTKPATKDAQSYPTKIEGDDVLISV